jgi:hypothetical protein
MVTIDAQPVSLPDSTIPHTVVLKLCTQCLTHVSLIFPGNWELPAFLRTRSELAEKEAEIAEIRRMAE